MTDRTRHLTLLLMATAVLAWSVIRCHDLVTWVEEVFPAIIGIAALVWIYPRFQFTTFMYSLISVHAIILMIGGIVIALAPTGFCVNVIFP